MTGKMGLHKDGTILMETYTGRYVNPLNLLPKDIDIVDIAHHLSLICRFNGACKEFYSVAQHSIYVASMVTEKDKLAALLHDAHEAYCGDFIRPWKYAIPDLKKFEDRIAAKVLVHFDCWGVDWAALKHADDVILATEFRDLMKKIDGLSLPEPRKKPIHPWGARFAEVTFLKAFKIAQEMQHSSIKYLEGD